MPIIEVKHLTKEYDLGTVASLKDTLRHTLAKIQGKDTWQRERFKALDDVNFSIEEGEVVGIIGHNGAGKSTLLKHLANITKPTHGEVIVRGSIAPLIEVGAGVNPELTGRENIFLNGAILGIPKKVIQSKLDEIIDFSELEQFIDTPVKRYSSGMTVKLGFSIATSMDADILIIDEVLAVGDLAFQRKCFDRMEDQIQKQGKTVLLVSHNIRQVERLCSRVILMDHGRAIYDGDPQTACNLFYEQSDNKIKENVSQRVASGKGSGPVFSSGELDLLSVTMRDNTGALTETVVYGEPTTITASFLAKNPIKNLTFGIGVHTPDLLYIANDDSILSVLGPRSLNAGPFQVDYKIDNFSLFPGIYAVRIGAAIADTDQPLFYDENLCHFQVGAGPQNRSRTVGQGFVSLGGTWAIREENEHQLAT